MTSRGTTPTYILTFPETIDLSIFDDIIVTITDQSYNVLLEKDRTEVEVGTNTIDVYLTQEETLALPLGSLLLQVNMTRQEGDLLKRVASEIVRVQSAKNLHEEVIE